MDFTGPIPLTLSANSRPLAKLATFIGHHDCRVYFGEAYIDIGAGSLMCVERVRSVPAGAKGFLGSVGRFCEFNESADVLVGGDHDNANPVNISFGGVPILREELRGIGLAAPASLNIGSGVIVSARAVVRGGVKVGDGAVIGAGAVVIRDVYPMAIVAGVPAKEISRRPEFAPWWDFAPHYLFGNLHRLNDLARVKTGHEWRKPRPRFVIQVRGADYHLAGFADGEAIRPFSEAPESVRHYLRNALAPGGQPYWAPDCWA